MAYKKMLARSFSKLELRKMAFGAFICCFTIAFNFSTVLEPYIGLPRIYFDTDSMKPSTIISNFSNSRTDVYEINGDVRIHGISSTIFIADKKNSSSWTIKPYPRKMEIGAMNQVTNFKIIKTDDAAAPRCSRNLETPAILFSTGGFAAGGNHFHAFSDILIPLFLTSHTFNRSIIFLITNHNPAWTLKYRVILDKLSNHNFYDIDKEKQVLCFSNTILGLKSNREFSFDSLDNSNNFSIRNFTKFLRTTFSLDREFVMRSTRPRQPRMLIVSRMKSRRLMNERQVVDTARSMGFNVVVKQMSSNLSLAAKYVNSFDLMVGVHGAALTNMVFLPENAIVIQIIPFAVEYFAEFYFHKPAESMNLKYLEYKVSLNETTFSNSPKKKEIYSDYRTFMNKHGIGAFFAVYLHSQDVILDLDRFRKTLLSALELFGT